MKKSIAYACMAAALLLVVGLAQGEANAKAQAAAAKQAQNTAAPQASASNAFTQSEAWNKVGANLQQAYLAAEKAGFTEQDRLECFVSANENIEEGDQSFLTSNGFIVQMTSGFTARGQMAVKDLPAVANLPFVRKIDTVTK